jgi:hypothetical protein
VKLPMSPEAVLVLSKLLAEWKPVARAALDPGTYLLGPEPVAVEVSGQLSIGDPVPRRKSVAYARLSGLALSKLSATSRAAVAREYAKGSAEPALLDSFVSSLGLPVEVRDGSARVKGYTARDLRQYLSAREEG